MKFSLKAERDAIGNVITAAARASSTKEQNPALAFVHLELQGDTLIATGSDLDTTVRSSVSVAGTGEGSILVPPKLLQEITKKAKPGVVSIDVDDETVHVATGKAAFSVRGLRASDYPAVPTPIGEPIEVPVADLTAAFSEVAPAASSDATRPTFTGVLFEVEENALIIVATDGFRLASREMPGEHNLTPGLRLLVPASALTLLGRLLNTEAGTIGVYLDDNQVSFRCGPSMVTTRLIASAYPPWRRLIIRSDTHLAVETAEIEEVLGRMSLLHGDIGLILDRDGCSARSRASDSGEAVEDIDGVWNGDHLEIWFSSSFLLGALKPYDGPLRMEMSGALRPCTITGKDASFISAVMPININMRPAT